MTVLTSKFCHWCWRRSIRAIFQILLSILTEREGRWYQFRGGVGGAGWNKHIQQIETWQRDKTWRRECISEEKDESGTWWVCLEAGGRWAGQASAVLLQSKEPKQKNIKHVSLKVEAGFFRVLSMGLAFKKSFLNLLKKQGCRTFNSSTLKLRTIRVLDKLLQNQGWVQPQQ